MVIQQALKGKSMKLSVQLPSDLSLPRGGFGILLLTGYFNIQPSYESSEMQALLFSFPLLPAEQIWEISGVAGLKLQHTPCS